MQLCLGYHVFCLVHVHWDHAVVAKHGVPRSDNVLILEGGRHGLVTDAAARRAASAASGVEAALSDAACSAALFALLATAGADGAVLGTLGSSDQAVMVGFFFFSEFLDDFRELDKLSGMLLFDAVCSGLWS